MEEDSSEEQKTQWVYCFGKRKVWGLDLNETREGFLLKGRGRGAEDGNGVGTDNGNSHIKSELSCYDMAFLQRLVIITSIMSQGHLDINFHICFRKL